METLKINKIFETREEMEKAEKELCDKYVVLLVEHTPQQLGEKEIYGIQSITHFGKR